jgi:hypothetical protein
MFGKRVTKLTVKAAQAVAEGSEKLKRKASNVSKEHIQSKKSKTAPSKLNEPADTSSPSPTPDVTKGQPLPQLHQQACVRTEEEEQSLHGDAISIDSDTESATSQASDLKSDGESSDAELGASQCLGSLHKSK